MFIQVIPKIAGKLGRSTENLKRDFSIRWYNMFFNDHQKSGPKKHIKYFKKYLT